MKTPPFIEPIVNAIGDISITEALDAIDREFAKLPDPDNHHNALTCPHCNPEGLVLVKPTVTRGDVIPPHRWTPDETKDRCTVCGDGPWGRHRFQTIDDSRKP